MGNSPSSSNKTSGKKKLDSSKTIDFISIKEDLNKPDERRKFVEDAYNNVQRRRNIRKRDNLVNTLLQSRDAVLQQAFSANMMAQQRKYPRLPSTNNSQLYSKLFCQPCVINDNKRNNSVIAEGTPLTTNGQQQQQQQQDSLKSDKDVEKFVVKIRGTSQNKSKVMTTNTISMNPTVLEGTHESLPKSSVTIFLKTHYAIEDEQNLRYVPYFGDDDKEDVVSELYNLEERHRIIEFGPEYQERDTNSTIDETLLYIKDRISASSTSNALFKKPATRRLKHDHEINQLHEKQQNLTLIREINEVLAGIMDVSVDRIHERYNKKCCADNDDMKLISTATAAARESSKNEIDERKEMNATKDEDSLRLNTAAHTDTEDHVPQKSESNSYDAKMDRKDENQGDKEDEAEGDLEEGSEDSDNDGPKKNSETKEQITYKEIMDSYRTIFCRRCFSYDCNMHGNLSKPSLDVQGELAVQKEKEGQWDNKKKEEESMKPSSNSHIDSSTGRKDIGTLDVVNPALPATRKRPFSFISMEKTNKSDNVPNELTALQKSICERAFLIFQGDTERMATTIGAPKHLVDKFVEEQNMSLKECRYVKPKILKQIEARRKKEKNKTSMKNYNQNWLKRIEAAEIHPFFAPCDHNEPCSEENCSCIKNACFCTKHCVWGEKSRNFFRGCACKNGMCRTKSCACYAAKRECDPDLCLTCGACTDPPNKPASKQLCRNDNIGMRRHCHLLLAKSMIEDAGWGIYTKHALKKGDFVHEYIGEVISQEEAERRGRIYDKVNCSYLFNLCSDYVVDASRKGNKTRFANHSSKPNCTTKMVCVNGDIRIGLFAKEDIEPQSELFFDYRYDVGIENHLITKPGMTVDWMQDPKMANQVSKKYNEKK